MIHFQRVEIERLIWDQKTLEKLVTKHQVTRQEVEEVFRDDPYIRRWSSVYHAYGRTQAGRYLFVVFIYLKPGQARIITARDMTNRERRLYQRERGE